MYYIVLCHCNSEITGLSRWCSPAPSERKLEFPPVYTLGHPDTDTDTGTRTRTRTRRMYPSCSSSCSTLEGAVR